MSITVKPAQTKSEIRKFVKVPFAIYKGNPYWIPPLIMDDIATFDRAKNPAFAQAEARFFIAYQDGRPVGRLAAIISHVANKKYGTKDVRFGWFDTIEDEEVPRALFAALEAWGRENGMETITGPHGFTDLDPQGMLIQGFDKLGTIAGIYNHPYYSQYMEKLGFQKEIDYVEFLSTVPHETGVPEKLVRLADRVRERGNFRLLEFKSRKDIVAHGEEIFQLLDESFEDIYGSVPMTHEQIHYYVKKYLPFTDPELIKAVLNESGEMIGFLVTMPSLSKAMQKARGRLFPLGWLYMLKALKTYEVIDFCLAGVRKNYRGQGVDLLMAVEIVKSSLKKGFKYAESNQELENNPKVQAQWKYFNPFNHKRRRIYKRAIGQ